MQNFDEIKNKIVDELKKRAPNLSCPVCGSGAMPKSDGPFIQKILVQHKLILVDGFFNKSLQKDVSGNIVIGGPTVPTVGIICENCGYLMEFAIGALGLLGQK